jgi:hypothetical protein
MRDTMTETIRDKIDNMIKNKLSATIVLKNNRKITTNPRFVFDVRALEQGYLRWSYNNRSDETNIENIADVIFQQNRT